MRKGVHNGWREAVVDSKKGAGDGKRCREKAKQ